MTEISTKMAVNIQATKEYLVDALRPTVLQLKYLLIVVLLLSTAACLKKNQETNRVSKSTLKGISIAQIDSLDAELTVLPPWTAITIDRPNDSININCWGRKYSFSNQAFPVQMYSQGVPLLNSPIKFDLIVDGESMVWENQSIEVANSTSAYVSLVGGASSKGDCKLKTKYRIEYDGLMTIGVFVTMPEGIKVTGINLNISYAPEVAKYFVNYPERRVDHSYSGPIPEKEGVFLSSKYFPYTWIGNDTAGLFWFCESTNNWPNASDSAAIAFERKENEIVARFNIVGNALESNTYEFDFGVQATPVKPLGKDWRKLRIAPSPKGNVRILFPQPNNPKSVKYHGYPEATDSSIFRQNIERLQSIGHKAIIYGCLTRISTGAPLYRKNSDLWRTGKSIKNTASSNGHGFVLVKPDSKSFSEVLTGKYISFLKTFNLGGIYLDGVGPYPWYDSSKKTTSFHILDYRRIQRNLYAGIKESNPNAIIIAHNSAQMAIPILAYADAYVDGEQFRRPTKAGYDYEVKSSYLNVISLEQFRAEFMGKQWGIIPIFLPEIAKADLEKKQPTLGLATLLLLHDVHAWPHGSNQTVWNKIYRNLDAFNFYDAKFIPYYAKIAPAKSDMKDVYVSVYKKGDGKILAIIGNLSLENRSGEITFNETALGDAVGTIYTWPGKKAISKSLSTTISLPPLSYKMLYLE